MSNKESIARAQLAIESGRALFREGILAESHAYLALALRSLLDAWSSDCSHAAEATNASERFERALLTLERSKYRHIARLSAAYRALSAEAPGTVAPSAPLAEREFDWTWPEVDRLNRFTLRRFAPVEMRRRFRIRLAIVLVPIVVIAGMIFSLRRTRPKVAVSSTYAAVFSPDQAVDRLEATEWMLAEGETGWLDLIFKSPRSVRSVTVVNSHNSFYVDRGAKKIRVTAFAGDTAVASVEGEFQKLSAERSALDLPLQGKDITRVRVDILSFFSRGGGLAEVEVH